MVVQARTLEFYGQYGLADEVIGEGVVTQTAHLREALGASSREVLTFSFKELGEGLSPYPFALAYPQDDHERFLLRKLADVGTEVEWRSQLIGFEQDAESVRATVRHDGSAKTVNCPTSAAATARIAAFGKRQALGFRVAATSSFFMSRTSALTAASIAICISASRAYSLAHVSGAPERHATSHWFGPAGTLRASCYHL
jgi:hypothetical protein